MDIVLIFTISIINDEKDLIGYKATILWFVSDASLLIFSWNDFSELNYFTISSPIFLFAETPSYSNNSKVALSFIIYCSYLFNSGYNVLKYGFFVSTFQLSSIVCYFYTTSYKITYNSSYAFVRRNQTFYCC